MGWREAGGSEEESGSTRRKAGNTLLDYGEQELLKTTLPLKNVDGMHTKSRCCRKQVVVNKP